MANDSRNPNVTLENAEILPGGFRNFSGAADQYTREGDRSFTIRLPRDVAEKMLEDGFSVKTLPARDEGDDDSYILKVAVSYKVRAPQVYFISGGQRTLLDESSINILDYTDIERADVMLNPYHWDVNGKQGVKAYLHKMFVTVQEDDLDRKYSDIPVNREAPQETGGVFFEE